MTGGVLTLPCATPQRDGLQAGLIGILEFKKKNESGYLSHCGDAHIRCSGISPGNVAIRCAVKE
jgi:hypothetical protein